MNNNKKAINKLTLSTLKNKTKTVLNKNYYLKINKIEILYRVL